LVEKILENESKPGLRQLLAGKFVGIAAKMERSLSASSKTSNASVPALASIANDDLTTV